MVKIERTESGPVLWGRRSPALPCRNQVDVKLHSQNPGLQVWEGQCGGRVLLASVLKELTLRTASVASSWGTESVPRGMKCPVTCVPLHTPEQAEEWLRRP